MLISAPYKMHLNRRLAGYLSRRMHVRLVSADLCYGGKWPPAGKRLWPMPRREMVRELVSFRPDVVLTDYPAYPSWYARVYSIMCRRRIPLLAWLLGDLWTEQSAYFATAPLRKKLAHPFALFTWSTGLEFSEYILPVCRWLERVVKGRLPEKQTRVLYNCVDPSDWLVEDSTFQLRHPAVGILQDNNILPKVRGLLWFSQVVKQMKDVTFYIAGGGAYTHLVKSAYSGLPNAQLIGKLPYPEGVRRFLKSIDAYVLPSGLDCCPTTLLEAALCGKPAIASKVGGIPELVKEGETGWTLENGREDDWASRIRSVIEDPRNARAIGQNARRFVADNFSLTAQASRLIPLFEELA